MKTRKDFYKHIGTGKLYVIELAWDGRLIGSCGRVEQLGNIDSYKIKSDSSDWIQENNDKLILFGGTCGFG